jgi:phage terminase small subunit
MPLPNKNRSKDARQMKRDEGGRHMHFSPVAMHVPSRAPSHLSSFTLTIMLKMIIVQWYKKEVMNFYTLER